MFQDGEVKKISLWLPPKDQFPAALDDLGR